MKLYQTKNALFYAKPTIVSRLMQLCDAHYDKYGKEPRIIYMTKKEWEDYEEEVCKLAPHVAYGYQATGYPRAKVRGMWFHCLSFRGIPVLAILEK